MSLYCFYQYYSFIILLIFFFFQAEDGIRDWSVTGVQTCALPISPASLTKLVTALVVLDTNPKLSKAVSMTGNDEAAGLCRSEERRVGKECRSRWSRYD